MALRRIPRGSSGVAKVWTAGLSVTMIPKLIRVTVYDEYQLKDLFGKLLVYKLLIKPILLIANVLIIVLMPLTPLFVWMPIMRYTSTTRHVFPPPETPEIEAINGSHYISSQQVFVPPWGVAVDSGLLYILDCVTVSIAIVMLNLILFELHPAVVRILWREERIRMSVNIGTGFAYAVSSCSLLPNAHHIAFQLARVLTLILVCHIDAYTLRNRLRMLPQLQENKKQMLIRQIWLISFMIAFAYDLMNHTLLLYISDNKVVLTLNLTNPMNGNKMAITNTQPV